MVTSTINPNSTLPQQVIQQMINPIITQFQPQKIILFGSYAYGTPTVDSDIDLLILMDTDQKPIRMAAQIAAAIPHLLPLDIMVWKPSDFVQSVARQAVFATEVMTKGVILYEAHPKSPHGYLG